MSARTANTQVTCVRRAAPLTNHLAYATGAACDRQIQVFHSMTLGKSPTSTSAGD